MILRSKIQAKGSLGLSHSSSQPSFDLSETPLWYLISEKDHPKDENSDSLPQQNNEPTREFCKSQTSSLGRNNQPPDYCLSRSSSDSTIASSSEDSASGEALPLYSSSILAIGEVWRKLEMLSPSEPSHRRHWQRLIVVLNNTKVEFYRAPKDIKAFVRKLAEIRRARAEGKESRPHNPTCKCLYNEFGICHPSLSDMLTKKPKCHSYFSAQTIRDHYQFTICPNEVDDLSRYFCLVEDNLVRSYTLQYAQVGLANDYKKRSNVVRMRAEGEQFLLYCASSRQCIDLVHGLLNGIGLALPLEDRVLPVYRTIPRRRRRRRRHAHRRYHETDDPANLRHNSEPTIHHHDMQHHQQSPALLHPLGSDPESITVLNCILTKWSSLDTFHQIKLLQVLQSRHGLKTKPQSIESIASGNDLGALTDVLRTFLSETDSLEIKDSRDNNLNALKAIINSSTIASRADVCQLSGSVSDADICTPSSVPTPSSLSTSCHHLPKMERLSTTGQPMEDYFNHNPCSLSVDSAIPEFPDGQTELDLAALNGHITREASSESNHDDFTPSSYPGNDDDHSDLDEQVHEENDELTLSGENVDCNQIYAEIDTDSENELDTHNQSPCENHEAISECDNVHQASILDYILRLEERLVHSSLDSPSDSSRSGIHQHMEKWVPIHHASQADNVLIKYAKDCLPSLPATASWKTTLLLREAPPLTIQSKGFLRGGLSNLVHGTSSSSFPTSGVGSPSSQSPPNSIPGGLGLRRRASSLLSGLSVSSSSRRNTNEGRSNEDLTTTAGLPTNSSTASLSQEMSSHVHSVHHWTHADNNKHRQLGSEFTTAPSQSFIRHVTKTSRFGI